MSPARAATIVGLVLATGCGRITASVSQTYVERRYERVELAAITSSDDPARAARPGDTHVELAREHELVVRRAKADMVPMTPVALAIGTLALIIVAASVN